MQKKLDIDMVQILTQPVVPFALHYVTPRTIMGKSKWDQLKKEFREKADHHCMICNDYVSHTPGDWLELHEKYDYDFENLIQKLTGYVSICHRCHMYIHQGLLNIQLQKGQITQEKYNEIKDHGDQLLKQFGLSKITYPSQEVFISANWQLDFNGNKYQNNNYEEPFL